MAGSSESVAILGVGLIGGSIGMALRARGVRVLGIGRDTAKLSLAIELGAIDRGVTEPTREDLASVETALVCTPVDRIAADALRLAGLGPEGMLVTDAGSTKRAIVEAIESDPLGLRSFVGSHPIAGSERQGVAYSRGDLFEGRVCVLTPTERTPADLLARARSFWTSIGCRLLEVDPISHDRHLALTSHLPHAVASALASVVPPEILPMAAGAYRDCTRVAGADAGLWSCIFRENKASLLEALAVFRERLDLFEQALATGDDAALKAWWDVGFANRSRFQAENPGIPVASRGPTV